MSNTVRPGEGDRGASRTGGGGSDGKGSGKDGRKGPSGEDRTQGSAIRRLEKRLTGIEERLDELERNIRLLGPRKAEDRAMLKQVMLQGVRDELADVLADLKTDRQSEDSHGAGILGDGRGGASGAGEAGSHSPGPLDDVGLLSELAGKLDSAREARENIYDFIFRLVIRQEINSARTKLLFLAQRFDVEPSLFDELDMMETSVNNRFVNTEELNLRWKVFEERVKAEIERLRSD